MRRETSTLGHASSTLQHSHEGLPCQGDCHLDHGDIATLPGYGSATIDERELRYLESLIGDDYSFSNSEALQLSSVPTSPLATFSSDLCGELDSAQDPLSSGYVGESRASAIDSPVVDHTRGYSDRQGHAYGYPTYATERSPGYPQETRDVSTSGDLANSFAGSTTYLGFIPSLHDYTSGQVIGSHAPSSRLSDPLLPLLQDPPPCDDFNVGDIPLPQERTQAEMASPPQFISSSTKQLIKQVYPSTPFPYIYPDPSPSNPTSYSTADGRMSYPLLVPHQNSSSLSPQEHLGHSFPIHLHTKWLALPGFHGRDAGSKMDLLSSGTLDDHSVWVGDHPSRAFSNHKPHPLRSHATYIPHNNTTGGGVDDHGNVDNNTSNAEKVVGLCPRLPLPPNQVPLSPHSHLRSRVPFTEGRSLSGALRRTRHSATAQSKISTKLTKARSSCDPAPCGWRDNEGKKCGILINYDCADHFAAFHHIRDTAWNVKVICCWCPPEPPKEIGRKNILRHLREAHLYHPRPGKGI